MAAQGAAVARSRRWSARARWSAASVALGVMALVSSPAVAQAPPDQGQRSEPADVFPSHSLMAPPGMNETGRIARSVVRVPGTVDRPTDRPPSGENAVTPVVSAPSLVSPSGPRSPTANEKAQLDGDFSRLVANLRDCRLELARVQQVAPADLSIPDLTLRWTISRSGTTADSDVLASGPLDPQIAACVKQRIASWRFTPMPRGPVRVEYSATIP